MYSRNHAILSGLVGLPFALSEPNIRLAVFTWGHVVIIGTAVDLDHFVIARSNRGDWTNLQRCISSPSRIITGQASIFDRGDVWRDQRLLSHVLIGGVLVVALWPWLQHWAIITGVAIYVHVVADLYSDTRSREDYLRPEN